jgi:outer membrane biosynthesis protein TonB
MFMAASATTSESDQKMILQKTRAQRAKVSSNASAGYKGSKPRLKPSNARARGGQSGELVVSFYCGQDHCKEFTGSRSVSSV